MAKADQPERCEIHYAGRVQGVGFRYTARRISGRFRVAGFVRNLEDGRVQLVAEGPRGDLDDYLAALEDEMGQYIVGTQVNRGLATGEFERFDIRH